MTGVELISALTDAKKEVTHIGIQCLSNLIDHLSNTLGLKLYDPFMVFILHTIDVKLSQSVDILMMDQK